MATNQTKDQLGFSLLRNFLALIVTFATLVCVSIGTALAFAAPNLSSAQLWTLIGLLFAFPVFGLTVITWLILYHGSKLSVSRDTEKINWNILSAKKQKDHINKEVARLAKEMKIPHEQLSDLRSAYIVAQDLALRKIQQEVKTTLLRHVYIGNAQFDAIASDQDLITCVQVTFLVNPAIGQEKINSILEKVSSARASINRIREDTRIRLLLVIATQLDSAEETQLRSSLVSKFSSTPVDVDIRLLDFQGLQKTYSET